MTDLLFGTDFDNTLVCYDALFAQVGRELNLLPQSVTFADKTAVKNFLVEQDREDDFTRLQGEVYGPHLKKAQPSPGARECLERLKVKGGRLYLVSHKTRNALAGPPHDLHKAALDWLTDNLFVPQLFAPDNIFLETSFDAKITRISSLGLTFFVDDLMKVLAHANFPKRTQGLHFSPQGKSGFASWADICEYINA